MKASVISLLLPLALLAATRLLYRSNCRAMQRFYWRIVFLYSARRLYTLLLLLTLILANTVFVATTCRLASLAVMFILMVMASYRKMFKAIRWVQKRRWRFALTGVIAVVLTAIPGLASAGISLAVFMAGALFFPSRRVRSLSRRKMRGTLMKHNPETIVTDYYCK